MSRPRDFRDYLEDIQQAAQKAIAFVQGFTKDSFAADEKTVFAVTRALEVLGEATKRVPQSLRDQHPEVPWRSMAAIRDKLIHDYSTVNAEVLWNTVHEDLPPLLPKIQRILDDGDLDPELGTVAP